MKSRQLILLLLAAVVLGGGGLWMQQQRKSVYTHSTSSMGGSLLGPFDVNAVTALRFTHGSNTVNVVKQGDDWVVRERGNYPANFADLATFIRKLSELKVTRPVNVGQSRLPMLQLTDGSATVVELLGSDGKPLKTLRLGKQSMKGEGEEGPMGGGGFPDGRYVQVGQSIALINDPLSSAQPKPEAWLAKEFIKVEQPVFIELKYSDATNNFALSRTNEFAEWTLVDAKEGEVIDKNKLWSFNSILSGPSFNDILLNPDVAALGLDHPNEATIRTAGGLSYNLKVGKAEGENYPVQVTVTGQLATERKAAADEKPEDKTRLDQEFKDKLAKLEQKLKTEQALGKWTFTVNKWALEPVLKKRSELLTDKKSDGKSPGGTPGIAPDDNPLTLPQLGDPK